MTAQQKRFNVLLLGDACVDHFMLVHRNRKNPESDAPLYTQVETFVTGGMGRNVLRALDALNIKVDAKFPGELADKIRIIDHESGEQYCRLDIERPSQPLNIDNIDFKQYDAVVVSDYCKGAITDELLHNIKEAYSGPKFLDTKKNNITDFHGWIIKINENEYKDSNDYPLVPINTIVTYGDAGATIKYIDSTNVCTTKLIKALNVNVEDVCGAGDSFLAGLVYGYLMKGNLYDAVPFAICSSGLSVTKRGTYNPSEAEVLKAYQKYDDK